MRIWLIIINCFRKDCLIFNDIECRADNAQVKGGLWTYSIRTYRQIVIYGGMQILFSFTERFLG